MKKRINKNLRNKRKLVIVAMAGAVILASVGSVGALNGWFVGGRGVPSDTMTNGLVGYWNFDEGTGVLAYDSSSYANNGTLKFMSTSTNAWAGGKVGSALNFDGTDDYLKVEDSVSLDITGNIAFEAWVKFNTLGTYMVFSKRNASGSELNYQFAVINDGTIQFSNGAAVYSNAVLTAGQWQHIAAVWDGSTVNFYRNGISAGSKALTASATANNQALNIGSYADGAGVFINGLIDEARIYNRTLSSAEIRYRYDRGGPASHLRFDEGSGTTAYDFTDNNYDGTLKFMSTSTNGGWATGKYGAALSFDGVDDHVQLPFYFTKAQVEANGMSWSMWIKTTASIGTMIRQDTEGSGTYERTGGMGVLNNKAYYVLYNGTDYIRPTSKTSVNDNDWHYVTGVFTKDRYMQIYVDGALEDTKYAGAAGDTGYANIRIAAGDASNPSTKVFFNGSIDDVRIYNYVRTREEIQLDYNAGFSARFGPNSDCDRDPGACMTFGLVGHWSFEESTGSLTRDTSTFANNGILRYMSTSTNAWVGGKIGSALNFDGADDEVQVATGASSPFRQSSAITYSFWVKIPTSSGGNAMGTAVSGGHGSGGVSVSQSGIVFAWTPTSPAADRNYSATVSLSADTWYHVAVAIDFSGSGTGQIYLNGVPQTTSLSASITSATPQTSFNTSNGDDIGGRYVNSQTYFNGKLDEVRVYSRVLSPTEIRYHYNGGEPVGHWKFDEGEGRTTYDNTNNNNDGTLILAGSATSSAWVAGKYGSALSLDGVNDYINAGNGASLGITGDLTLGAWIKTSQSSGVGRLLTKGNANAYQWELSLSSGKMYFAQYGSGCSGGGTGLGGKKNIADDQWHYVAAILVPNSVINIYVDGVLDATIKSAHSTCTTATASFLIGVRQDDLSSNLFNGLVDDVRIYNYARTTEQIRQDYNAGLAAYFGPQSDCDRDPGSCMTQGLVGNWDFEEGSSNIAHDASIYANNGTLSGPTWSNGKVGGALRFDGNDFVNVGSSESLKLSQGGSLEAWFKLNALAGGYGNAIIIKGENFSWTGFHYILVENSGRILLSISDGTSYLNGDGPQTSTITAGVWYHVVATWDNSRKCIYLDGVLQSCVSSTIMPKDSITGSFVNFGRAYSPNYYYLNGLIDEVRIYSRVLSDTEVRYHYNKGGPIAYWKLNEGQGSTAYDATDNNYDGTITGASWVAGKYGSALSFDGVDDSVEKSVADFRNSDSAGTISAWFKTANDGFSDGYLVASADEAIIAGNAVGLYVSNSTGKIGFFQRNDDTADVIAGSTLVGDNQWHHAAVVSDGLSYKLYIDGRAEPFTVTSGANTGDWLADTTNRDNITIGIYIGFLISPYVGLIDDVRIYNYARTSEQIRQDYNAGNAIHFR